MIDGLSRVEKTLCMETPYLEINLREIQSIVNEARKAVDPLGHGC
jgi:hypothetical protein